MLMQSCMVLNYQLRHCYLSNDHASYIGNK